MPGALTFASHLLAVTVLSGTPTAAEIDWVPREALDEHQQRQLLWFKDGAYVGPPISGTEGPIDVYADETTQVLDESIEFIGNVVIENGGSRLLSPRLRYVEATGEAEIDGPLQLRDALGLVTGSHATLNLTSDSGEIFNGSFLLHEAGLRGSADRIERRADTSLVLDNTSLTRCEPDDNSWLLSSATIELDPVSGRGVARNVRVKVGPVPIAYSPYLSFPLDERRKSGLLTPSAGYDDESGAEVVVPYYFNIAPTVDATYTLHQLSRRGLFHDGQLRFLLGQTSNEINLGFLADDKLYDPNNVIDETPASTTGTEPDRWYLNVRHTSTHAGRLQSKIDFNSVSDNEYLSDLDSRLGGNSLEDHVPSLSTTVTDYRIPALDRSGSLTWHGRHWRHAVRLQGFQLLDPARLPQYERLPELSSRYRNRQGPVSASMELQYAHFDRDNNDLTGLRRMTGSRLYGDLAVSTTARAEWGFIKPTVGLSLRRYDLDDVPVGIDPAPQSVIPRFSLDTGLIFDRFFNWAQADWQQTLEPRAFYLYVDEEHQAEFPEFDAAAERTGYSSLFRNNRFSGLDRIGDENRVGIGVTSRLFSRADGIERVALDLGQSFHFRDRTVTYRAQSGDDPTRRRSPLFAQLRMNPFDGLFLAGTYEWEPDVSRSNRGTLSLDYRSADLSRLINFRYVYASPEIQQSNRFTNEEETDLSFIWPVAQKVSMIGRWNFGWDRNQTIESLLGVEFNNCCLKARLVLRRFLQPPRDVTIIRPDEQGGSTTELRTITPADRGIFLELQLKGLASLGRRLDILLDQGIPGYRYREDTISQ